MGYTLSTEQRDWANEKLQAAGLYPRVRVELQDYREAEGEFDKFVSIGMFEHVGKEFYSTFFEKAAGLLTPQAIGVLHTIGKDLDTEIDPWVVKYAGRMGRALRSPPGRSGSPFRRRVRTHVALLP